MFSADKRAENSIQIGNGDFEACAYYLSSMDYLEFITSNGTTVDRRIDEFLTLIFNAERSAIVGLKIKGLRYHFNEQLKDIVEQSPDDDFILLVLILEKVIESIGPDMFNEINRTAYKDAARFARSREARVQTSELSPLAA